MYYAHPEFSIIGSALDMLDHDAQRDSYRMDPARWAKERMDVFLWSKQREIMESVRDKKRTLVASCHGTGKSMSASVAATWWIDNHPPGEAIVVSTAPTYAQVNKILWEEIRKHHRRVGERTPDNPLLGYVTQGDEWKLNNGEIVAFGRKPSDHNIHGFQGIHRRFVLVIIDEACGVADNLWTAVEAITTTGDARVLAIGNPDDPDTEFGRAWKKEGNLWNKIQIPASTTPNFTGEEVPALLRDVLIQKEWAQDRLKDWGADDPRYLSKVMAQFPDSSVNSLFGALVLATGFNHEEARSPDKVVVYGVDVARYGDDSTAVVRRCGDLAKVREVWRDSDTTSTAWRIMRLVEDDRAEGELIEIRVDSIGVGAGVLDTLVSIVEADPVKYPDIEIIAMVGSSKACEPDGTPVPGYGNARAMWYDRVKQYMRNGLQRVHEHEQLRTELEGVRFRYGSGRMYIESKEDIRKRGGRSPDLADAFIYACAPRPPEPMLKEGDAVSMTPQDMLEIRMLDELAQMEMQIAPY